MRTIWWFVVVLTLAGSILDGQARPARVSRGGTDVHTMDGSGEPPRPPKP